MGKWSREEFVPLMSLIITSLYNLGLSKSTIKMIMSSILYTWAYNEKLNNTINKELFVFVEHDFACLAPDVSVWINLTQNVQVIFQSKNFIDIFFTFMISKLFFLYCDYLMTI